jgi:hypothetical protein
MNGMLKAHFYTLISNIFATRYRLVPTFGDAVIRRFSDNAAETKNMTAHGYEDLLQA